MSRKAALVFALAVLCLFSIVLSGQQNSASADCADESHHATQQSEPNGVYCGCKPPWESQPLAVCGILEP